MVAVAGSFAAVLAARIGRDEAMARLQAIGIEAPFANGFVQGSVGTAYTREPATTRAAPPQLR
jgi:hypothetical protein